MCAQSVRTVLLLLLGELQTWRVEVNSPARDVYPWCKKRMSYPEVLHMWIYVNISLSLLAHSISFVDVHPIRVDHTVQGTKDYIPLATVFGGCVGCRRHSIGKSGTWGLRGCPSQWLRPPPFFCLSILRFSGVEPLLGGGPIVLHVPGVGFLRCACLACRARSGRLARWLCLWPWSEISCFACSAYSAVCKGRGRQHSPPLRPEGYW